MKGLPPSSSAVLVPRLGFLFVLPAFVAILLLGLWIVTSGVTSVRGVDLNVLYTLQKALGGLPLYTDPEAVPFDVAQYAPLQYLVVLGLATMHGIGPDQPAAVLFIARGVSLVCSALLVGGVYLFGRRTLGLGAAAAGVVATLACVLTSPWLFLTRPDALAALLALASLAVVAVPSPRLGTPRLLAAVVLVVAAMFAKQSQVQVAAVLVLYVAWAGGWRAAAGVTAGIALLGGAAFALCASYWPHFVANVVGGVDNGINVFNLLTKTLARFVLPQVFLIGLAGLAVLAWVREPGDHRRKLFVVALPMLMLAAVTMGLKQGSAENYFIEFTVVALLGSAWFLTSADAGLPHEQRIALQRLAGLVLLFWLPVGTLVQLYDYWFVKIDHHVSLHEPLKKVGSPAYAAVARRIDPSVLGDDGYVLAFPLPLNVQMPRAIVVPQKEVAIMLHGTGAVGYAAFRQLVADGRIRYIVTGGGEDGPTHNPFLGARLDGYALAESVGEFRIFVRQGEP